MVMNGKTQKFKTKFCQNKGKKMMVAKQKTKYRPIDIEKFSLLFFFKKLIKITPLRISFQTLLKPIHQFYLFFLNFSFEFEIQLKTSSCVFFAYKIPTWSAPGIIIVFLALLPRISPYSLSILGYRSRSIE